MQHSSLILQDLITAYVPFLPLERTHVKECIKDALIRKRYYKSKEAIKRGKVEEIADELAYVPEGILLFAANGCKRVDQKIDLVMFDD